MNEHEFASRSRRMRWGVVIGVAAVALGGLAACTPTKPTPQPQLQAAVFECTGATEGWVVPPGVTSAVLDAYGAVGGDGSGTLFVGGGSGASGGRATAALAVTPGEVVYVTVGCAGEDAGDGGALNAGDGGFNGGGTGGDGTPNGLNGAGGGGGGGASDVRRGGAALGDRVAVGAGGGGGGGACGASGADDECIEAPRGHGGAGAHPVGGDGVGVFDFAGGGGGTQAEGGSGGESNGTDGGLGVGGPGGLSFIASSGGGGGGGAGLHGGGGGGNHGVGGHSVGAGGGGGSSFGPAGSTFEDGMNPGDGLVVVFWWTS